MTPDAPAGTEERITTSAPSNWNRQWQDGRVRVLRIVRTIRVMQRMGGAEPFRVFFEDRATGGLLSVLPVAILVLEYGAMAMLWAEEGSEAKLIVPGSDALW